MNLLVKFTDYADSFQAGHIYMNTLDFFWKNGFEDQKDILEGVFSSQRINDIQVKPDDEEFMKYQLADFQFQAVGFSYCNVFCMSTVTLNPLAVFPQRNLCSIELPPNMEKFGQYAVVVDNETEYLRRTHFAAKRYQYLCGRVNYYLPMNGDKLAEVNKPHILFKSRETFDMKIFGNQRKMYDSFDKIKKYEGQREWRLCLYRGEKSTEPFILEIGDISDITHKVRIERFEQELNRIKYRETSSLSSTIRYYGNVNRKTLRESFYHLGDDQVYILSLFG